ncbi:class I SAM-dependent methyltransferase [Methyloversatilis thermotolerans]|uniref:class I SAM-dependent methyltransferase n=1 Tax=Methyloversatilis thermotolerans TaxID=1346290 RepID=UPI0003785C29|nr:class I SAM-dependent methyltransferase [Methyloversatilis thermotolerans]
MESKEHWERVYSTRDSTEVSWFQPHAALSLKLILDSGIAPAASIIDVGGGASALVDDLLDARFTDVSVLDLSGAALATARDRLGERAQQVCWLEADILQARFERHAYDVWHDRAVFHFLTDAGQRAAYIRQVLHAVKPGGRVIVATFAEDGPERCSGLPVMRYSADGLHAEFGAPFELLGHEREAHRTPGGSEQKFVYCFCRKLGH